MTTTTNARKEGRNRAKQLRETLQSLNTSQLTTLFKNCDNLKLIAKAAEIAVKTVGTNKEEKIKKQKAKQIQRKVAALQKQLAALGTI